MPESSYIPSHKVESAQKPATLPVPNPSASFWLSNLDPVLKSHRTTEQLPVYAETVIVGTGITGTTAAWTLAYDSKCRNEHDHASILVLEAREVSSGATGRNGGHLQPLLYDTTPDIAAFEIKNCETVAAFIKEHNIQCEYRAAPACRSFWTEPLCDEARLAVAKLHEAAPELAKRIQWIDSTAAFQEAQLSDNCVAATLTEGAASLWPYKYVAWRMRHLVENGKVNLQTNTPVTSLEPLDEAAGTSGSGRYRVHTPRGSIITRNVLLATNAYTSHLLPHMSSLIVPVRETMTAQHPPSSLHNERLKHSHGLVGTSQQPNPSSTEYLISRPYGKTVNVLGEGHLMLGGARTTAGKLPKFGVSDDSVVDPAVVQYLRKLLPRTLNFNAADAVDAANQEDEMLALERAWTGIWGQSRDGAPWVGRAPYMPPGLWVCGGYSGHGMPNATLCAKAVVGLIMAENDSKSTEDEYCERLVASGDLPRSYLITEQRLERAQRMPEAAEMDRLAIDPLQWLIERHW